MNRGLSFVLGSLLIVLVAISGIDMIYTAASGSQKAVLYFAPDTLNVQLGQSFNLSICIANVQDLTGWGLSLSWNSSVIELNPASSRAVAEGSFLKAKASTSFQVPQYNVGTGRLSSISCAAWPNGVSGNGTLLIICFRAVSFGETSITISGITLSSGSSWSGISYDPPKEGHVTVGSTIHSVAVSIECPPRIFVRDSALVNATVVNSGSMDEPSVNLSILINGTVVISETAPLRPGSSFGLSHPWTPSLKGTYLVEVTAKSVVNETEFGDYESVSVIVTPKMHDIAVLLGGYPDQIAVNQTVLLNLTIINLGAFNETGIELQLMILYEDANETIGRVWSDQSLTRGFSNYFGYEWKPENYGGYNITAYAHVAVDDNPGNNVQSLDVYIPARSDVLIVSDDGGHYSQHGTSFREFESALTGAGWGFDVWFENDLSVNGSKINAALLEEYGIVIWTCGDYGFLNLNQAEQDALMEYNQKGGDLLFEGGALAYNLVLNRRFTWLHELIQIDLDHSFVTATGIEPIGAHMITQELGSASFTAMSSRGIDCVKTVGKGFSVMRYLDLSFPAVTAVDGSETGNGSVVYFSFSLYSLSSSYRNLLVRNIMNWFQSFSVSVVVGTVINSPPVSTYFVYGGASGGNELEFGAMAGGMLYSLCRNEQAQGFADTIDQSGLHDCFVSLFGTIPDNRLIADLNARGVLPVTLWQDSDNPKCYKFKDKSGETLCDSVLESGKNSTFVIQVLRDEGRNITYLVVCGLDWRGMWAAGMYLSRTISGDLRDFWQQYYVLKWEDANGDGIPQLSHGLQEVTMIASG
jgi:hypothetical protein